MTFSLCLLLAVLIAGSSFGKKIFVSSTSGAASVYTTVVLDAGHGGFDGGASTADGVPEKNINLPITLDLDDFLKFFGYHTVLVRSSDESVEDSGLQTIRQRKASDLHNRMKMMENTPTDSLFVSVHQNFFTDSFYSGAQVFYSPTFSEESSALADCIQSSIVQNIEPDNTRQIKKCGTSVFLIYNAVRPAVLVECGFLSNKAEAERLQNPAYQCQTAFCIAMGIVDYNDGTE